MPTCFLLHDNAIVFLRLKSLKEKLLFYDLNKFLPSNHLFSDGKLILYYLYLFKKVLTFVILLECFPIFYDSMQLLQHIESIYYFFIDRIVVFLFFVFYPFRRIYM